MEDSSNSSWCRSLGNRESATLLGYKAITHRSVGGVGVGKGILHTKKQFGENFHIFITDVTENYSRDDKEHQNNCNIIIEEI